MVYLRIITLFIAFIVFANARENNEQFSNKNICEDQIIEILRTNVYNNDFIEKNTYIHLLSGAKNMSVDSILNEIDVKSQYKVKIQEFIGRSDNVEIYLNQAFNTKQLIVKGQPKGATGIGTGLYWNYLLIRLNSENDFLEFSSMSSNPKMIFIVGKNKINYIEILDNYPRPASNKEFILDYMPININVYKDYGSEIYSMEYKCYDYFEK